MGRTLHIRRVLGLTCIKYVGKRCSLLPQDCILKRKHNKSWGCGAFCRSPASHPCRKNAQGAAGAPLRSDPKESLDPGPADRRGRAVPLTDRAALLPAAVGHLQMPLPPGVTQVAIRFRRTYASPRRPRSLPDASRRSCGFPARGRRTSSAALSAPARHRSDISPPPAP